MYSAKCLLECKCSRYFFSPNKWAPKSILSMLVQCRFMDNLQTEVLEIEFLSYSNGMNTISEEDFAHILLRYTNVENTSSYLENVRSSMPEEQVSFQARI